VGLFTQFQLEFLLKLFFFDGVAYSAFLW